MQPTMNFLKGLAGGDGSAEDGGGAGSWLASIKEKSKEIAEVYKRDIGTCCRPEHCPSCPCCSHCSLLSL